MCVYFPVLFPKNASKMPWKHYTIQQQQGTPIVHRFIILKCYFLPKGSRVPFRMTDSLFGAGNVQSDLGISCHTRK